VGRIKSPGFCEIDTVSHDGGFAHGEHAFAFFYPNLKCVDKREPKTPFQRILELSDVEVPPALKRRLIEHKNSLMSLFCRKNSTGLLLSLTV
jgi:hypothetical protein